MFKKVLISDDLDSSNYGVLTITRSLGIKDIDQVQYCDDAYLKLKKARLDDEPFDLLITSLNFKPDHRKQKYTSGIELIKAVKKDQPDLKVIVYSVEERIYPIRRIMKKGHSDAFVSKGRSSLLELAIAIQKVYQNKIHVSPSVAQILREDNYLDVDEYDIQLISMLSQGLSQHHISEHLKNNRISPSSLSSIEKRLNKLRLQFKANNAIHLVAIVKDLGMV